MLWTLVGLARSVAYANPPVFEAEDDYAIIHLDKILPRNRGRTLAEYYYDNFDQFRNRNEQYQALLFCLTELARLIDDSATQAELEYSIFNHLHKVMDEIDGRDRNMKAKFRQLESEASSMRTEVDRLVNQTRAELEDMIKQVRKDVTKSLKGLVRESIQNQQNAAKTVADAAGEKIAELHATSSHQAAYFFAGFQVIVVLCLYMSYKWGKLSV
jgi:DNA anti-recombination protein RmuC